MMATSTPELPASIALVDDEADFSDALVHHLIAQGVDAHWFADSESLLCAERPFGFGFYILDLGLPGIDGLSLLRVLRRRTQAGVLVLSGRMATDTFEASVDAGADMYLSKPLSVEQVLLAVKAVHRRVRAAGTAGAGEVWRLDPAAARLFTPDGTAIELSASDVRLLERLARSADHVASRQELVASLGIDGDDPNLLNATVYRLRRRIESAASVSAPLQSRSRVGYQFKGRLVLA